MTKHYRSSIHGRVRIWHSYIYIYCFIVRKNSGQSRISTVVLASSRTYTSCKTFRPKASSRSNLALPNPDLNRMRQGSNRQQGCMGCIAAIGCRSVEGPFVEFQASFMERVQREVSQKEQELLDEAWFNVVTMWSPCGHTIPPLNACDCHGRLLISEKLERPKSAVCKICRPWENQSCRWHSLGHN
jgi:hypothetical protein